MLSEQQQRIMGYFIEEAKDHLNTIEQGLLNLQSTVEDPEMVNEVFRAAHSVKGGAAMLGIDSMHKTAHRLEDYFKILKEYPVKVDQAVESLLFRVFDTLQELLDQLQGPFGLTDDKAESAMTELEPVFVELDKSIEALVQQSGGVPTEAIASAPARQSVVSAAPSRSTQPQAAHPEESALQLVFKSDVPARLRDMLQLFKQSDDEATRQQLQETCTLLIRSGEQFDLAAWCQLVQSVRRAIANPDNTYRTLAPIVIKDLKRGQELVLAGQVPEICASSSLLELVPPEPIEPESAIGLFDDLGSDDLADLFADGLEGVGDLELDGFDGDISSEVSAEESESLDLDFLSEAEADESAAELDFSLDLEIDAAEEVILFDEGLEQAETETNFDFAEALEGEGESLLSSRQRGPEVGAAELNSLADLFEGEVPDLGETWQQEESLRANEHSDENSFDIDIPSDFSDLLLEQDSAGPGRVASSEDDLAVLFGEDAFAESDDLNGPDDLDLAFDAIELDQESADSAELLVFQETDATESPAFELDDLGLEAVESELADFLEDEAAAQLQAVFGVQDSVPEPGRVDEVASEDFDIEEAAEDEEFADLLIIEESSVELEFSDDGLELVEEISVEIFEEAEESFDAELQSDLWTDEPASEVLDSSSAEGHAPGSDVELEPVADPWSAFETVDQSAPAPSTASASEPVDDFFDAFTDPEADAAVAEVESDLWIAPSESHTHQPAVEDLLVSETETPDLELTDQEWDSSEAEVSLEDSESFEILSLDENDAALFGLFGEEHQAEAIADGPAADRDDLENLGLGETESEPDLEMLFGDEALAEDQSFGEGDLNGLDSLGDLADEHESDELFETPLEDLSDFDLEPDAIASEAMLEDLDFEAVDDEGLASTEASLDLSFDSDDSPLGDVWADESEAATDDLGLDLDDLELEAEPAIATESADDFDLSLFEDGSDESSDFDLADADLDFMAAGEPDAAPEAEALDLDFELADETELNGLGELNFSLEGEDQGAASADELAIESWDAASESVEPEASDLDDLLSLTSEADEADAEPDFSLDFAAEADEPDAESDFSLDFAAEADEPDAESDFSLDFAVEADESDTESDFSLDFAAEADETDAESDFSLDFAAEADEADAESDFSLDFADAGLTDAEESESFDLGLDGDAFEEPLGLDSNLGADDLELETEAPSDALDESDDFDLGLFEEASETEMPLAEASDLPELDFGLDSEAESPEAETIDFDLADVATGDSDLVFETDSEPDTAFQEDEADLLGIGAEAIGFDDAANLLDFDPDSADSDDGVDLLGFDAESENFTASLEESFDFDADAADDAIAMAETPVDEDLNGLGDVFASAETADELDLLDLDLEDESSAESVDELDGLDDLDLGLADEPSADLDGLDDFSLESSEQSADEVDGLDDLDLGFADESSADLNGLDDLDLSEASFGAEDNIDAFADVLSESDDAIAVDGDDDFADLEDLLAEETAPAAATPSVDSSPAAIDETFSDLEALLEDDNEPEADEANADLFAADDEFEDLEKLLEDADKTLGGSPTVKGGRRTSATIGRRLTGRRGGGVLSEQSMRVSVKHLDNLSNLVGELVVNRNSLEQDQERLRQFLDNLLYQVQQLSDVGQRMRDLYERSLLESSLLSSRHGYHASGSSSSSTAQQAHATGVSFDALEMDRFTGFHSLSQEMIELIVRVREASSDIEYIVEETDQVTRNFRQVTTQLQEGLTRSRMVPFAQTADRLPRAVRDISIKCGKQAELIVEGRDTLIDKMILEQLYDPMTHLVNNAITHGIETPEARRAAGKSEKGEILVRAFHQGNQTVIVVSDDGAGIDPDIVKDKAVRKGLVTPAEAREMTSLDVYDLLFHPGFSTRDQADDFAGRGVGMDVVRTRLAEMRGAINVDSTVGQGTSFTIRLPLTLSISKALSCISNRARIAFPMDGVEDMLDVPKERVQMDAQGQPAILWRDILLPFQPLADLLKYNRTLGRGSVYGGGPDDDVISIVVLRSAGTHIALQVDQVLGEQEIVIKQLQGPVPKPLGIAGATVLGDGRIMPIADVLELIDLSMGRIRRDAGSSLWDQGGEQVSVSPTDLKTEPTVLIVDDSITVRELLSMSFNKVGYRVEQARDGQEAWEKLRSGLPCDLVFCDIEMPRMDGLELLSRLQKDPQLKGLPIAMLTSRGADRHRQMAVDLGASGYFTKPYLEEALLDAAQRMLKGEVLVHRQLEDES